MSARRAATPHLTLVALLGLMAGLLPAGAVAAPQSPSGAVPGATHRAGDTIAGRVIVRFSAGATEAQRGGARAAVDAGGPGASRHLRGVAGLELLTTRLPVDVAVAQLRGRPGVAYAEPDRWVAAAVAPNDPDYPNQWALENGGDHDIDAEAAWAVTTGSPNVIVAVIDSGVDASHPDLAANIWTNLGESVTANGIDDDQNGRVDDRNGWDFWDGDRTPADLNGHGTHVAGIVAARRNNGIGVSGVAPQSRIMALRTLGADGFGSISAGVEAIEYAWRNGARVANISWGWSGGVSQQLLDAINEAGRHGMTVVAAAGNAGADADLDPFYPAAYPSTNLLSVAATNAADGLWPGSNRGATTVDIGAPGDSVLSTYPGGYAYLTGTSMAAPHVAGVAALILAANPTWTVNQVRVRIFQSVRPLASLADVTATGGSINAAAAVLGVVDKPPAVTITSPGAGSAVLPGSIVTFAATAIDPEDGDVGSSLVWTSSLQGVLGSGPSISRSNLVAGDHVITAAAADNAGHHPIRAMLLTVGPTVARIAGSSNDNGPSIAVAPNGTPSVAWVRYGIGTFVASPGAGATWPASLIVPSSDDRSVDLAIGPDGRLQAAIQRSWSSVGVYSDPGVLLAAKNGAAWSAERISDPCRDDSDGCLVDSEPEIVLDGSGSPHVIAARTFPTFGSGPGQPAIVHIRRTATGATATEIVQVAVSPAMASIARGAGSSLHVAWIELAGDKPGIWYANNAAGVWIATRLSIDSGAWDPRVAVGPTGQVRVLARTAQGIWIRTRPSATAGDWTPAGTSIAGSFGRFDLAQASNGTLHLVLERTDAIQNATGIVYATNASGSWVSTVVTTEPAVEPSIALDGTGRPHLAFSLYGVNPSIAYATNSSGSWVIKTVVGRSDVDVAGYTVDGRGVAQAVISRYGAAPGLYLGQRSAATWSLARVTTTPADGGVGFATSSIGEAHILFGTYADGVGGTVADPSIQYATNVSGTWRFTRLAANSGTSQRSLVLDPAGKVHVVFPGVIGGKHGLVYATNRTGAWVSTLVAPGNEMDPAFVVDAAGKVRIAARLDVAGESRIRSFTNASGSWTATTLSSGGYDFDPVIAIDPEGESSIAYWRDGGGIRLTEWRGTAWFTREILNGIVPHGPQLRIDSTGQRHIVYADASTDYAICLVPLCPLYPGLREAVGGNTGPFTVSRVTFEGADVSRALARGRDGRLAGAFTRSGVGAYEVTLQQPFPRTATTIDDLTLAAVKKSGWRILKGRLHAGATYLAGKTLVFKVDGVPVGSATTGPDGIASLPWTAAIAPGAHTFTIGFAGGGAYLAARLGPRPLTVQP